MTNQEFSMKWKKKNEDKVVKKKKCPEWLEGNIYDNEDDWYAACMQDYREENESYEDEYLDGWDIKG